ncbi:MAG: S-methyl-5-thioribose-1-phosphate isomerase [Bacteroidales bacterium]
MKVNGQSYRSVWMEGDKLFMIDQQLLPFRFQIVTTSDYHETCQKIKDMTVRGAGTIGAAAAFAMAQAFQELSFKSNIRIEEAIAFTEKAKSDIEATRPTARDLFYSVNRVFDKAIGAISVTGTGISAGLALSEANHIADQYSESARLIGVHGKSLINNDCNILTHCNAGWLALVDYGSALSPVFQAFDEGKNIHVWVDETRPRGQGAKLTAWELLQHGVPHTIIADNAAGLLMARGKVDLVITGADRIAANGDTANKIGTLEKAILAKEFNIPFYVAAPSSTFDFDCSDGSAIIIEDRDADEVHYMQGPDAQDQLCNIRLTNPGSAAFNPAFDITPARYITAYITEKGIIQSHDSINILASDNQGRNS